MKLFHHIHLIHLIILCSVINVLYRGGKVVAFEMGPPFHMLRINKRFCLHLNILVDIIINFVFIHISTIAAIATSFQIQFRLNPELNLDIYNLAIYDKNGTVFYKVKLQIWTNFEKNEAGFRLRRMQRWDQQGGGGNPSGSRCSCSVSPSEILTVKMIMPP